jgi:hypothetical protein
VIEPLDPHDPIAEVEALIRAAGNYVQPSDDLRPRVMEAVRAERVERTVRWRICQAAVLFFVLNLLATSTLHNVEIADGASLPVQRADGSSETLSTVEEESWDTVESFRELRRRQAYLLRLQL